MSILRFSLGCWWGSSGSHSSATMLFMLWKASWTQEYARRHTSSAATGRSRCGSGEQSQLFYCRTRLPKSTLSTQNQGCGQRKQGFMREQGGQGGRGSSWVGLADVAYYKNRMEEGKETIIGMEELQSYTRTLDELQAKQLLATVQLHPQLKVERRMGQKWVEGDPCFLRQLSYLLKQHAQRQPLNICDQSSLGQPVNNSVIRDCASLRLTDSNFLDFVEEVKSIKTSSPLQTEFTLDDRFTVRNRCNLVGKIILLFRDFHELVLLQAMAEGAWNLQFLIPVRKTMIDKKLTAARCNNEEEVKLLFLRAIAKEKVNWQKFAQHISMFFGDSEAKENHCILTTSSLLAELRSNGRFFGKALNLVIHEDDLRLPVGQKVEKMTVLHPSFPLDVLADLAVAILNRNACEWQFRGELLEPITCFNIVAMEGREASEFKILMAGGEEKQRYLLMVEENRLFKVVQLEKGQHKLQEASFAEIADEVYLEEIAKMRTLAVLHRLQFITFPRFCKGIYPLSSAGLAKVGPNCYSRLLYYDWKLSQLSFRAEITINAQIQDWQQDQQMRFDTGDSIISYLGKLSPQTEGFKRRFRIEKQPCIEGSRLFCQKLMKMKLAQ